MLCAVKILVETAVTKYDCRFFKTGIVQIVVRLNLKVKKTAKKYF